MRGAAAVLGRRRRRLPLKLSVALPRAPRHLPRWLLAASAALVLLAAGYGFWLRNSSLVAVDDVTVTGLTTEDAARVRAALTTAARSMTTLHVDRDELDQVVSIYPVVRELRVSADFPHELTIHVIEQRPAALANLGGENVPVAGDGTLLRGLPVGGRLPALDAEGGADGDRLSGGAALRAAAVAGAAPAPLRPRLERITRRAGDGIVIELRDGPEVIFGSADRARAKWLAASRVLADPDAEGASYIDVRLPGRPAAGGLPAETVEPVAPAGYSTLTSPPAADAIPAAPAAPADATGLPAAGVDPATQGAAPDPTTGQAPTSTPTAPTPTAAPVAPGLAADGTVTGAVAAP
jgi:cell division protein FtsQ